MSTCFSRGCSSSLGGREVPETRPREGQQHGGGGSVGVDWEGDRVSR